MWLFRSFLLVLMSLPLFLSATAILPANEAFIPRIQSVSADNIRLEIDIKPQHYLYRQRLFQVTAANPNLLLKNISLSEGSEKTDNFFGTQSVWYGGKDTATLDISYENPQQLANATLLLAYQGCRDGVICYPPQRIRLPLDLPVSLPLKQQLFKTSAQHSSNLFSAANSSSTISPPLSSSSSSSPSALLRFTDEKQETKRGKLLLEDKAFALSVTAQDSTTLQLRWQVADAYYLYRDKTHITAANRNIAQIQFSQGQSQQDEFFGEQIVYRGNQALAYVYLKQPQTQQTLTVQFQGCADQGVCYPIMQREVTWDFQTQDSDMTVNSRTAANFSGGSVLDELTQTLSRNLWLGVGLLLLAGIALALTPCVLPMLPILLGMLTKQRQISKTRSALLSSTYALGMATTLAIFGLIVANTGINIQLIFQRPLWLILFAAVFMLMGLAMLGVFSLAMPARIQTIVTRWQNRLQTHRVFDVFIIGALSSLVVGPCIAPPLVAILAFIATTNDSVLGAVYLFSLGMGMGLPLIVFATLFTHVPKTGEFSRLMTRILALLMFAVGLWLLARLLSGSLGLILWGIWLLGVAYCLWNSRFIRRYARFLTKALAGLCLLISCAWLIGGIMGNSNPLKPFSTVTALPFKTVNNLAQLRHEIANSGKPIMLDLYADWCVSCQEIEHFTLTDARVVAALADWTLLKLDITDTRDEQREILAELGLIGPPALLFFDQGKEIKAARNIGTINADALLQTIETIK